MDKANNPAEAKREKVCKKCVWDKIGKAGNLSLNLSSGNIDFNRNRNSIKSKI